MTKKTTENKQSSATKAAYTKQQFMASKRLSPSEKDILYALLQDDQKYTHEQIQKILQDFLKKEVK